jgi:hypothetical protein
MVFLNQVGRRCRGALISRLASAAKQAGARGRNIASLVEAKIWTSRQRCPTTFRGSRRELFWQILSRSYSSGCPLSPTLSPFIPNGERGKKGIIEPLVTEESWSEGGPRSLPHSS